MYTKTVTRLKMKNVRTELEKLFEQGKLYYYENRCWYTCFMAWNKLPKSVKNQLVLVEGECNEGLHYWLENVSTGEIYEVHYSLMESTSCGLSFVENYYTYKKERELNLSNYYKGEEESKKYAHNPKTKKSRYVWIHSIEEKI